MTTRFALVLALICLHGVPALADEPQTKPTKEVASADQPASAVEKEASPAKAEPAKTQTSSDADPKKADTEPSEEDLRKKMRELEKELQAARDKFQEKAEEQRTKVKKDTRKALDDIKLPENPTREQAEAYLAELRKACEGRRSFSSSDPATIKLKELPPEHCDLLITETANRTSLRYYANYAMRDVDPELFRERFVSSIEETPNNIGIIVMHGWCEDIRDVIIQKVNSGDSTMTSAWFQAAVELDEPSLYPKLHEITTQSRYASQFINMLDLLPDYDLAHTVDVCWQRVQEGKLSLSSSFAAKAASFGNVDALGTLVEQLSSTSNYISNSTSYNSRRTNVLRYIDYRGSNKDIQAWYKANKDKLVFDYQRKRFLIPEDF